MLAGSQYKVFCPASPWLPGLRGSSEGQRGRGRRGRIKCRWGLRPAANTNTASRLPAPFSSLPYIPARPAPRRVTESASLGLPDVGRAGSPRLASAGGTPLRPQLGGRPACWEAQAPPIPSQALPLHQPTHQVTVGSFLASVYPGPHCPGPLQAKRLPCSPGSCVLPGAP